MATQANNVVSIRNSVYTVKGRDKAKREAAYCSIAINAFLETSSRGALIASINDALGKAPTAADIEAVKRELRIGRVVAKLPAKEFPIGCTSAVQRTDWVREQLDHFAPFNAKRVTAKQKGRRSPAFDKALAPTREYVSQIMAEVGASNAKPQDEKNKAKADKRAAHRQAAENAKAAEFGKETPTPLSAKAELVKPGEPMTPARAHEHIQTQANLLAAFCANKANAGHICGRVGKAVLAFKKEIAAAIHEYEEMQAAADAKRAESEK